jgi:hypothetical protein
MKAVQKQMRPKRKVSIDNHIRPPNLSRPMLLGISTRIYVKNYRVNQQESETNFGMIRFTNAVDAQLKSNPVIPISKGIPVMFALPMFERSVKQKMHVSVKTGNSQISNALRIRFSAAGSARIPLSATSSVSSICSLQGMRDGGVEAIVKACPSDPDPKIINFVDVLQETE